VALAAAAAALAGFELFWRARGFEPSLNDDPRLWAEARDRAAEGGPEAVASVGSSRIQVALDPRAFAEAGGGRPPVQLAVAMGSTLPLLRDLALDPGFRGLVLAEVNPRIFFDATRQLEPVSQTYLDFARGRTLGDRLETPLRLRAQERLVSRLPALAPQRLVADLLAGEWPAPAHIRVDRSRFRAADFRLLPLADLAARNLRTARMRQHSRPRILEGAALGRFLEEVEDLVRRQQAKGGRVAFVRLPTSAHILADERRRVPRERTWDLLAARTSGLAIHFEDHPSLAGFTPPDGEHLDQRDAARFTRALASLLARAGALGGPAS
jgi:hypothetical protein